MIASTCGVSRREAGVGAVGDEQPGEVAPSPACGHDARGRGDGELEALRCVRGAADVEQHARAALPRQLVLAHHQVVVAGGRRPVHTPEVVADDVGAQRVEVLAEPAERVGVLGARVRVAPVRLVQRPDRVQLRVDGEIGARPRQPWSRW